ncbi:GntR family transcriptional regulator [Mesorhizobium salmacidum]|uniref:GntR family transcriptional regulator n=1 Tax=Mesorhizobium salmacidum TaxID=3015171 RepID=A0ABU8L002_9HYPH
MRWEADTGYVLAIDLAAQPAMSAELPAAEEDELAEAILRDRSARRLDQTVTVAGLMRRYGAERKTVLKSLNRLTEENFLDRAPGQSWLFRRAPDDPGVQGESYEFRLLLEPAAILTPGFRLDGARRDVAPGHGGAFGAARRRVRHRRIPAARHRFPRHERRGLRQPFVADALADHLRLRRLPGIYAGVNVFRLKQSLREHLNILDHLESRQYEVAADLLRIHLRLSRSQRPQAASRGAPALFGIISRPD